jgi:hypothetical protein
MQTTCHDRGHVLKHSCLYDMRGTSVALVSLRDLLPLGLGISVSARTSLEVLLYASKYGPPRMERLSVLLWLPSSKLAQTPLPTQLLFMLHELQTASKHER